MIQSQTWPTCHVTCQPQESVIRPSFRNSKVTESLLSDQQKSICLSTVYLRSSYLWYNYWIFQIRSTIGKSIVISIFSNQSWVPTVLFLGVFAQDLHHEPEPHELLLGHGHAGPGTYRWNLSPISSDFHQWGYLEMDNPIIHMLNNA